MSELDKQLTLEDINTLSEILKQKRYTCDYCNKRDFEFGQVMLIVFDTVNNEQIAYICKECNERTP